MRDLANTEDLIVEKRFRDIYEQISSLSETVDSINTASDDTDVSDIVPALNNFLNNSDFIYADQDYNGSTYTDDDKVLAEWLVKAQASSTAWSPNTTATESAESITTSAYPATPSVGAVWDTSSGSITLTGGYKVATKLPQKNAHAGAYLAVSMNISKPTGITLGDDLICKVSIWDNTDLRILRGSKPTLASTKNGSHTGGTVTRQYILEVLMPDGRTFYSDTSSFTTGQNQVINSVSAVTPDSTNTVSVSWTRILGASRYRIYRRTPSEADTNWYLVGTVTNGTPLFVDTGGVGGGVWTVPSFTNNAKEFARAEAFLEDLETFINTTTEEVTNISFGIRIPTNFSVNGNQYLVIEFLKSDYTDTTSTEIPTNGIRIDRVGLSYTNGRWTPSAKDMAVNATVSGNPNPPASSGSTGGNPPSGGGILTCVEQTTPILVWSDDGNHYYLPANSLVIGDRLVCWDDKDNCLAPTVINKVIKGISKSGYYTYVADKEVLTSFSHRYINDFNDFEVGTRITLDSEQVLYLSDDFSKVQEMPIKSIEQVEHTFYTRTFKLSNNRRNYIANGLFSHNAKAVTVVE